MGSEISKIVAEYEILLASVGVKDSDYSLILDSPQGVGFFPENGETERAMRELHDSEGYSDILDKLEKIVVGSFDDKESYYIRKRDFSKYLD